MKEVFGMILNSSKTQIFYEGDDREFLGYQIQSRKMMIPEEKCFNRVLYAERPVKNIG